MSFTPNPIKFGTDGWRGVIAADFTCERVAKLVPLAAQVLLNNYGQQSSSRLIIVGYDRRFLAENFALVAAESLKAAGFDVLLSTDYAPTPAFSWAAYSLSALGAIVITASHNPYQYLGLKVKGGFGGSVSPDVTKQIELLLSSNISISSQQSGTIQRFDPWSSYCQELQSKVNIELIKNAIASQKLKVYADVMHGAAATGLNRLLGIEITEINSNRDGFFGGKPPEPLPKYLTEILHIIKTAKSQVPNQLNVGLVFDGDCDRIAAIDNQGNFLSSQILIPILVEHLATRKGFTGEIVKTISGSDLIPRLAKLYNLPIFETAIGYKFIAERMLTNKVLIGGEESGGIGYGNHIPERDALLSALYTLEAIVESGRDLGELYQQLQTKINFSSSYDRIDLPLVSMEVQAKLIETLTNEPLTEIAGKSVTDCITVDGYKFRLADDSWLLIRFSGTEPVLRLYSEALTSEAVENNLAWAKHWAESL